MDKRIGEIVEKFIAGMQEYELVQTYSIEDVEKAKRTIKSDYMDYSLGLERLRLDMLYEKNIRLGDFKEARSILVRINEIDKQKFKKNGRVAKYDKLDKELFESLCAIQCTKQEICDVLKVSDKTLDKFCDAEYKCSFSEIYKQKKSLGKESLRRAGFKMAHENPTMNIFYSKNFLGMTDKQEIKQEVTGTPQITTNIITNEEFYKLKEENGKIHS